MEQKPNYIGRFAPSPSGPLHFGSLVAALASYLDARHHNGTWLLRIEDLDPPREQADAPGIIIAQLKHLGFAWDGEPIFQSHTLDRYQQCLDQLGDQVFLCSCSRKSFDQVYPGRCRGIHQRPEVSATRLQVTNEVLSFDDLIQGQRQFDLERDIGDFILRRKDGLFAYQLAVVVDDHDAGITHVIRGSDLLDSTPRQIYLARCLGFESPVFGHLPVMADQTGQKLSKQAHARPIELTEAVSALKLALNMLGQVSLDSNHVEEVMNHAIENWNLNFVPKTMSLPSPIL